MFTEDHVAAHVAVYVGPVFGPAEAALGWPWAMASLWPAVAQFGWLLVHAWWLGPTSHASKKCSLFIYHILTPPSQSENWNEKNHSFIYN